MEGLGRKKGRAPVHVAFDDNLTLSFKVPSSVKLPQARSILREEKLSITTIENEEEDEEDSWETKDDFNLDLNEASRRLDDNEWEEDAEAFPDDFPILLVNLSKVSVQHMGAPLSSQQDISKASEAIQEIFGSTKFSYVLEVLLEQGMAYHTTYGVYKSRLAHLTAQGEDVWAAIDYPASIDEEVPLSDLLDVLHRATQWKSVNYIKDCMAQSSRDIKWKAQVIFELEKLAESEHERRTSHMASLSAEIEQLSAARNVYTTKLQSLDGHHDTKSVMARRFATTRLEETEEKLNVLLDEYLNPVDNAVEAQLPDESLLLKDMNVLDMIVSMIFSRLPREPETSMESHYRSLRDSHQHIRRLWLEDFGRLPQRTSAVEEYDDINHEQLMETTSAVANRSDQNTTTIYQDDTNTESVDGPRVDYTADDEGNPSEHRREKKVKAKKKKKLKRPTFEPFACVGGLSMLQMSQDEALMFLE
ncbi:unnamed protein product [Aphanomyces euteiches]|uniref:Uncharacterized protein n=1 Tax=Aphanomyces euteiches TaxID=100861 RepID=A0A6G0X176_9STRA|nr:hypothetical protein Ae201684_009540 [Aphanomyces euteiches]KAH9085564.1 hypothetical protein Ae201684P_005270 [Aphanomyces euteiches]